MSRKRFSVSLKLLKKIGLHLIITFVLSRVIENLRKQEFQELKMLDIRYQTSNNNAIEEQMGIILDTRKLKYEDG